MDPFALLGLPRRPLLSEDQIGTAYRKLAGALHPDQPGGDESRFKELGEAVATLRDPARRLRALMDVPTENSLPSQAADLFPQVASILHHSAELIEKHSVASQPLSKALLVTPLKAVALELSTTLAQVRVWKDSLTQEVEELDRHWPECETAGVPLLANSFAFAARWEAELRERELALMLILS